MQRTRYSRYSYGASNRDKKRKIILSVIAAVIIIWIGVALFFVIRKASSKAPEPTAAPATVSPASPSAAPVGDAGGETDTQAVMPPAEYEVDIAADQVTNGDLILVNREHPYDFETNKASDLTETYTYGRSEYTGKLCAHILPDFGEMLKALAAATGNENVMISSAHRTFEYQQDLYARYERDYGGEYAAAYAARPGESEHHTGLTVDLGYRNQDGTSRVFGDTESYKWLKENSYKFGFIERYTEEKAAEVGFAAEPWHYRYVGVPHSVYIYENGLCYEEYVSYVRENTSYEKPLTVEWQGTEYRIYAASGTSFTVGAGDAYTVSGDNAGGVIITAWTER